MMLVIDQDQFVAEIGIGEADAARPRRVGDLPHGAVFDELRVRKREQRRELIGRQALNTKVHDEILLVRCEDISGEPVRQTTRFLPISAGVNRIGLANRGCGLIC